MLSDEQKANTSAEHVYESGENPQVGDEIYAGDKNGKEEFTTIVRSVRGSGLTTAGWPEAFFEIKYCRLVAREPKKPVDCLECEHPLPHDVNHGCMYLVKYFDIRCGCTHDQRKAEK